MEYITSSRWWQFSKSSIFGPCWFSSCLVGFFTSDISKAGVEEHCYFINLTYQDGPSIFGMREPVWNFTHLSHPQVFLPAGDFLHVSHCCHFFPKETDVPQVTGSVCCLLAVKSHSNQAWKWGLLPQMNNPRLKRAALWSRRRVLRKLGESPYLWGRRSCEFSPAPSQRDFLWVNCANHCAGDENR